MKLGDRIRYQKCLIANKKWSGNIDKEATKEFAKTNGMRYLEGDIFIDGWTVLSKWKVKSYPTIQEGIICGIRYIDITGGLNDEYVWEFGKRKKVYLVARNLTTFDKVPEEFIIAE